MKNITCLLVLSFCLLFSKINAQSSGKIATAKIVESGSAVLSRISFVNEKGESQTIPLQKLKMMGGNLNDSIMVENQKIITRFINEKKELGYEIKQLTSSGENFVYTLIIFEKKD
jgi:hypothetical protein